MGKHKKRAKIIRKEKEAMDKHIQGLKDQLMPGEKLLTCPTCQKNIRVQESQGMVTCVRYGGIGIMASAPIHPGEIRYNK